MKRNFVVGLCGSLIGFGMLLILLSTAGSVGARGAEVRSARSVSLTSNVNTATTVDSAGNVGYFTSITLGADGLGLISYNDGSNSSLKVLHCGNAACNSGNISTTVDSSADVGWYTSIAIGADGLGLISYYDATNKDLKVLHCGNAACNSGNISTTVDGAGDLKVGKYTSITLGADGLGLISYNDDSNLSLKVLHCGNAACNSGNLGSTLASPGYIGGTTSITVGADGLGLISYYNSWPADDLMVLHCGDVTCSSDNTATTVDSAGIVGSYSSVTIGADGLGLISYYDATNKDLKVLHCGNVVCNSGNINTTVASEGSAGKVGMYTSITLGADGLGLISYLDVYNGDLKTLHCGSAACNSGNISTTVDGAGAVSVGDYTSITLGADGLGLISYLDITNYDLKVLHCGSTACTPYTIKFYLPLVLKND